MPHGSATCQWPRVTLHEPKIIELLQGIQMLQAKTSVGTTLVGPPCRFPVQKHHLYKQWADQWITSLLTFGIWCNHQLTYASKTSKGFPYSLLSVQAVSPQGLQVIHPTVGCHYFPRGLRLPSQPQSITAPWPVPSYTAWWQRHIGVNNLPKVVTQLLPRVGFEPTTCWSQVQCSTRCASLWTSTDYHDASTHTITISC